MKPFLLNRGNFDNLLALSGVVLILLQVLLMAYTRTQVALVLVGILINQVGVWGLASRALLPNRRVHTPLRREVDGFIALVRRLNDAEISQAGAEIEGLRRELHEAVDRMATAAGRTEQSER